MQLRGDVFAELWRWFGPLDIYCLDRVRRVGATPSTGEYESGAATAFSS